MPFSIGIAALWLVWKISISCYIFRVMQHFLGGGSGGVGGVCICFDELRENIEFAFVQFLFLILFLCNS